MFKAKWQANRLREHSDQGLHCLQFHSRGILSNIKKAKLRLTNVFSKVFEILARFHS